MQTGKREAARELGIDLTVMRVYARMVHGMIELRYGKIVVAYAMQVMPGLWEYITEAETGYVSGDKVATAQQLCIMGGYPVVEFDMMPGTM
jgi:hypothetical protein